ncbi:MnmC family methyltransferase [Thermosynechococcus sp. HN-54]|uniref:tRNA (5-methylaminomethyl-2-thiouridine)(34)-methyltransferase MnmD n=1 Tax=Thermosynechococcus sp. HN-54 TaxID=2933959 RepID=UPI00202CB126|nr:MnmC family methyltransferase [Thermosynechococcus sp. HN-54]URR36317.1 MnmC family methyltransferase [Thermosynechococcus sp. HN-54]
MAYSQDLAPTLNSIWQPQPTADGSFTFFSPEFGETFHSLGGARQEAFDKFAIATDLPRKAQASQLKLLDICYGLGYNTAAALEVIWQHNPTCYVTVVGLELDPRVPQAALAVMPPWSASVQEILQRLADQQQATTPQCQAQLLIGDARQTIQDLVRQGFQADAIFLDPFSPQRCPQLWTVEFLRLVAQCLALEGHLATYCRAAAVRSALQAAGLHLGTLPIAAPQHSHEWAQGTVARWQADQLIPLSPMEQEHLQTRAGIPYRDPQLRDSPEVIRSRRQAEQQTSHQESTSHWRRRWGIT